MQLGADCRIAICFDDARGEECVAVWIMISESVMLV